MKLVIPIRVWLNPNLEAISVLLSTVSLLKIHNKGGKLIQALHPKAQNLEQIMLSRKNMIIIFNSFVNVKNKMNPYCIITNFHCSTIFFLKL